MPVLCLESDWMFEITVDAQKHELAMRAFQNSGDVQFSLRVNDRFDNRAVLSTSRELVQPDTGLWYFFHSKTKIIESKNSIEILTCPVEDQTLSPYPAMMVHYRFDKVENQAAVRVQTWFTSPLPIIFYNFSWMHLRPDETLFEEYEGFGPPWQGGLSEMKHPMRFESLAIRNNDGFVALTDCGEAMWTPDNPDYSPEWSHDCPAEQIKQRKCMGVLAPCATLLRNVNSFLYTSSHPLMTTLVFGAGSVEMPQNSNHIVLPSSPVCDGELFEIEKDGFGVAIKRREDGVTLAGISLTDFKPDFEASIVPMVRLVIRSVLSGEVRMLTSDKGWTYTKVRAYGDTLDVYLKDQDGIMGIAVHAIAVCSAKRIDWSVKIHNDSPDWSVLYATYPGIGFTGGKPSAVLPEDSGVLIKDAYGSGQHASGIYPSGFRMTMPCIGIYDPQKHDNNGLYVAVHDSSGARKDIVCDFLTTGYGAIEFSFGAKNIGRPANSFELAGQLTIRQFSGDWYDFGLIYRDYVHNHASWLPLHGRQDSPQWMRDVPLYIMDWMPNDNPDADPIPISIRPSVEPLRNDWYQTPIRLAQELQVPIGYHLYNWHWIPFNNDFPHYFPVKEDMVHGVQELHKHGIYVMPYINGRLWDTKDRRGEDYMFESDALADTSKSRDNKPDLETYASHEPDGTLAQLAAMCPTSVLWRNVMLKTVLRLFNECHVDAVYLDQIAAACVNLCSDIEHKHTPGNGDWWVTAYRLLMDRLNMERPDGHGFTTECNAEVYANAFDGFLTWAWISSSMVPVFPLVYGGYIAMLGRNTNGYKKNDLQYYRFHIAQAVLFGQQIGWINSDLVDNPDKLSFMKMMTDMRYRFRDYFSQGDMLRPPHYNGINPTFVTDTGMGRSQMFVGETLLSGSWRMRSDGRVLIILVNIGEELQECDYTINFTEYSIGSRRLEKVLGDGELTGNKENCITCILPAHNCLVLEMNPKEVCE